MEDGITWLLLDPRLWRLHLQLYLPSSGTFLVCLCLKTGTDDKANVQTVPPGTVYLIGV